MPGPTKLVFGTRISEDRLTRFQIPPDIRITPAEPPTRTQQLLAGHKAVLASMGITSLAGLGKLSLPASAVSPLSGLAIPSANLLGNQTMFQSAFRYQQSTREFVKVGGTARFLNPMPKPPAPPSPTQPVVIPVTTAYWAASWIEIPDNALVVIKPPIMNLVIITEKLTVGQNVTFTWERPAPATVPAKAATPSRPATPPTSTTIAKPAAAPGGGAGIAGGTGSNGIDGPTLEIWAMEVVGRPAFDVRGQDGFQGGPGGDGGPGANGAPGKPDEVDMLGFCKSGPGNGGDGGPGGPAGNGGTGGNGGNGGRFSFYAPQTVLTAFQQSFFISTDGGLGGPGGMPGVPGPGGQGGPRGNNAHGCQPGGNEPRTAGSAGAMGAPGAQGPGGHPGQRGGASMQAIDLNDFRRELTEPAIISLSPARAKQGDTVTVGGLRFTPTDKVLVNGTVCPATVVSDTLLTFVAPLTTGGSGIRVQVQQQDGTLSNTATLYVLPTLGGASPTGTLRPGTTVTLTGSGFAPGMRVRVNDQEMPDVVYRSPNQAQFRLVRPVNAPDSRTGETVAATVVLGDGTPSNSISLVLDTFRMLVFGDSIAWGQGLEPASKFSAVAEQEIRRRHGDIGVYRDVLAHSGAIIGVGDNNNPGPLDGEVPTSYPTVMQQVDAAAGDRQNIDLVLLDGGINDTDVRVILNPTTSAADLRDRIERFLHQDMKTLLTKVTQSFPNARVIVTGYYRIISEQSDATLLDVLLMAAGVGLAGIPGALAGLGLAEAARASVIENCRIFETEGNAALRRAVDETNQALGAARVFFADPGFRPENAALAPQAFIYGIKGDLSPEDPMQVAAGRAMACTLAGSRTDLETCKRASVGHPNARGAEAYAAAIRPLLV